MSAQTGAGLRSAVQQQLTAVQATILRLQLLQREAVGDASGARLRGQLDPVGRKPSGGQR